MDAGMMAAQTAWGDPIATWDFSSGVTAVDFVGLAGYRDLLIEFDGITNNSAGTEDLFLRVSTDNGSTFFSTGYKQNGTTATNRIPLTAVAASAVALMGEAVLRNFNSGSYRTRALATGGPEASATAPVTRASVRDNIELNNALRLAWSGGAQFAAGKIRLYGRRG